MNSKAPTEAYVWIWLPGETEPVVAGKLEAEGDKLLFAYGRSYLARENAISIYDQELPLRRGTHDPLDGLTIPGCIRDAAPNAWGRRVIINRLTGMRGPEVDTADLSELTYLLESGSDRVGALDFQKSPTEYVPRQNTGASYAELLDSARKVEEGTPLTPELDMALMLGTPLGGARPKALVENSGKNISPNFR